MRAASIQCQFCGERTREHPLNTEGLQWLNGLYLAHLVESHWEMLCKLRDQRVEEGMTPETLTAWQRI